jgi:glycosyltransferase involved in cell wall biosynthesis
LKVLQIEHAPNPIFSRLARAPSFEECKVVCIGWLTRAKGADIIFGALSQLPPETPIKLVWIGGKDAEMERSLRAESPPDFWRKVTIREHLSPDEVAGELSSATLFMHGARADNSPNSVKEAVVAGVPIIAPEIGGIPDYVLNGKNGFLFANGDVNNCREKVRQALAHPLFSRGLVDADTLGCLREYLSAETMAAKFHRAYRETLEVYGRRGVAHVTQSSSSQAL